MMLSEDKVDQVERFKYLKYETYDKVWMKWREASHFLCHKMIPIRLKSKLYKIGSEKIK